MEKQQFEKPSGLMIDLSDIPSLRRAYDRAIADEKKIFRFKGAEVLVDYAKYLLEYADSFKKKNRGM